MNIPGEDDLNGNNTMAMVVWSDEDVGTMVEKLCGPDIRTNFDNMWNVKHKIFFHLMMDAAAMMVVVSLRRL